MIGGPNDGFRTLAMEGAWPHPQKWVGGWVGGWFQGASQRPLIFRPLALLLARMVAAAASFFCCCFAGVFFLINFFLVFISLVFIAFFLVCASSTPPHGQHGVFICWCSLYFLFLCVFAGVIIFFHSLSSEVFYFGGVDFNGRRSLAAAPPPCDWPT